MTFFEWFYKVIILQAVCVVLIISSMLTIKYFFKDEFQKVKAFYRHNVVVDTDINEVLGDAV